MADVLADLRRSLTHRLEEVEKEITDITALTEERDRLRAALDALGEAAKRSTPRRASRVSANKGSGRPRAKPGANAAKILAVIGERPGVTAVEISQVAKLPQPTTYTTIRRLAKGGQIEEVDLGTGRGWRTREAVEPAAG
jgi:hypothetical protein